MWSGHSYPLGFCRCRQSGQECPLHTLNSTFGIPGRFGRLGSRWDRRRAGALTMERLHLFQKVIEFGDEQRELPVVLLLRNEIAQLLDPFF